MTQKYGYRADMEAPTERPPCLVCDDPYPSFSWTDLYGEGYCLRCGTPYQLKGGELAEGETYPRCNIIPDAIPILREFWAEHQSTNGAGTFMMWQDYPDQLEGRKRFNAWDAARTGQ